MPVGQSPHIQWWKPEAGVPLHKAMWDNVKFLREKDGNRQTRFLRNARLYANNPMAALTAEGHSSVDERDRSHRIRLNVTRGQVDTVQAEIAKNRPRAAFLTENANFGLQQAARRLEQFMFGIFSRNDLYSQGGIVFRDAQIFGTGISKVFGEVENGVGRIRIERGLPWDLFVDSIEAVHGQPRSLYQQKLVDRSVLIRDFPEHEEAIREANRLVIDTRSTVGLRIGHDSLTDQVLVVEGWHLPSGPGADDGLHAIVLENITLTPENERQWNRPRFPFAFQTWAEPLIGLWGESLVEELDGVQIEINELAEKIQTAMYHAAVPTWWVEGSSKIPDSYFHNDMKGRVARYQGTLPVLLAPPVLPAEVFNHLDRLFQIAFQISGVSQLASQSQKPSGLDSGAALREFNDIQSRRFVMKGLAYEHYFMQVSRIILDEAKELSERGFDVEVTAEDRRRRKSFLTRIRWSEININEDQFEMKIFPASAFPNTPAGKKAAVESLFVSGIISRDAALELLDYPDLDSVVNRELAPIHLVLDIAEMIIEDGEEMAPEPFMDLELTLRSMQAIYMRAKIDRVPGDRLDMLRRFMDATNELIKSQQRDLPTQALPAEATPQSEVLQPDAAPPGPAIAA